MKKVVVGFLGLSSIAISALLIYVAIQPDEYSIERSALIKATPASLYQRVIDLKAWDDWSPFKDLDPQAKVEISNPSDGKGARISWVGNEKMGEGTMTILDATPNEKVVLEQVFVKPMPGKALLIFKFVPVEAGTKTTWRLQGKYGGFVEKAICTCMSLDAMLGPKFEEGLSKMKSAAEKAEKPAP